MQEHLRLLGVALLVTACRPEPERPAPQGDVTIIRDALDATTGILGNRAVGRDIPQHMWDSLFSTQGYQRLKERELAMRRPFTDSAFRAFLLSDTLLARLPELLPAVRLWSEINLGSAAAKAAAYLPAGTPIRANLYPLIKPRGNSFVHRGPDGVMGIFIYIDPTMPPSELRTTLAHELHHIGYSAACPGTTVATDTSAEQSLRRMLGAFGEGLAMLAAAGGPDVDPNAMSRKSMRETWASNMSHVGEHLAAIDSLIQDVASGRVTSSDSVMSRAVAFYGDQGPWYTVGWLMGSTIEKASGRDQLIKWLCDPAALVREYQKIIEERQDSAPRWSQTSLKWLQERSP
jgi:hypothetical protein